MWAERSSVRLLKLPLDGKTFKEFSNGFKSDQLIKKEMVYPRIEESH